MKILIVGGGIAGPALASFLASDSRFEVTVVEQAPEFKDIGYGISVWPTGARILNKLGVLGRIQKNAYSVPWISVENKKRLITSFFWDAFSKTEPLIHVSRAQLHAAIVEKLRQTKCQLKLNTKFISSTQKDHQIRVELSDGSIEEYDLLVGADGTRSRVREANFGTKYLKKYGWALFLAWIHEDISLDTRGIIEMLGNKSLCRLYPLENRFMIAIDTCRPQYMHADADTKLTYMRELSRQFGPEIERIVSSIKDPAEVFYDCPAHVNMPMWHRDRVVLIGDAQHAVSTIAGLGASVALEDAWVLAEELKAADLISSESVDVALKKFALRREKRLRSFRNLCAHVEKWALRAGKYAFVRNVIAPLIPVQFYSAPVIKFIQEPI